VKRPVPEADEIRYVWYGFSEYRRIALETKPGTEECVVHLQQYHDQMGHWHNEESHKCANHDDGYDKVLDVWPRL
jgi:hypothetical protein